MTIEDQGEHDLPFYLATVARCAAACGYEMTDDDWMRVWENRHRVTAFSILPELGIFESVETG